MPKIYSTKDLLLEKMKHYCSYQERCHKEVLDKMFALKIDPEWRDEILLDLMREDFINEERYARSMVRGKFKINSWGKVKIRQNLKIHGITEKLIAMALEEIDESEYFDKIAVLLKKKYAMLANESEPSRSHKAIQHLMQKGYEHHMITQVLGDLNLKDTGLNE
jgi:regulatory protein